MLRHLILFFSSVAFLTLIACGGENGSSAVDTWAIQAQDSTYRSQLSYLDALNTQIEMNERAMMMPFEVSNQLSENAPATAQQRKDPFAGVPEENVIAIKEEFAEVRQTLDQLRAQEQDIRASLSTIGGQVQQLATVMVESKSLTAEQEAQYQSIGTDLDKAIADIQGLHEAIRSAQKANIAFMDKHPVWAEGAKFLSTSNSIIQ